ncbi:tRNA synthetases class II-domain-containing protein [Jackrogersella minutella]|nr:tRNA synthetases class II-domain-containing protein [Jackrogersella minutella]
MARFLSNSLRRNALRCISGVKGRPLPRQRLPSFRLGHTRFIHKDTIDAIDNETIPVDAAENEKSESFEWGDEEEDKHDIPGKYNSWTCYSRSYLMDRSPATPVDTFVEGMQVTVHGFLGKRKDMSAKLCFCEFEHKDPRASIQIVSQWQGESTRAQRVHHNLRMIPAHSPVVAHGIVKPSGSPLKKWDLALGLIECLNPFPKDIPVAKDMVWPLNSRNLQMRFDPLLRDRLRFRDSIRKCLSRSLESQGFIEVETPILFKSTPEGAREFLVPTRRQGYAYALPQSPQQYKQLLMAGGISKYFQFARCFRDEDHRADRQPEFTQLDLEMTYASGKEMVGLLTRIVLSLMKTYRQNYIPVDVNGVHHPMFVGDGEIKHEGESIKSIGLPNNRAILTNESPRYPPVTKIEKIRYDDAMSIYGTDKPDLRIRMPWVSDICLIDKRKFPDDFLSMITKNPHPMIHACKFHFDGGLSPRQVKKFIRKFMDTQPVKLTPGNTPAVFVSDSKAPLRGLSAMGHEAAQRMWSMKDENWSVLKDGDVLIIHARAKNSHSGSSTDLGRLRTALYAAAVQEGLIPKDREFRPLWVSDFPLFSQVEDNVGQGGQAGICSTHHPFTAPATMEDVKLLRTDPLKARGDHYDLVINGIEIGGGSRRIHMAQVQEYVLRDVLQMSYAGVQQFSHLIEALRAGCPPHAGFAFGFDRLISVLLDVPTIRDVIAFPKTNKGEDLLVGSPSRVSPKQQSEYHLFGPKDEKVDHPDEFQYLKIM